MYKYTLLSLDQHTHSGKTILLQYPSEKFDSVLQAIHDVRSLSMLCDQTILRTTEEDKKLALTEYKEARTHFLAKYKLLESDLKEECSTLLVKMLQNSGIHANILKHNSITLPLHILDEASGIKTKFHNLGNGVMLDASKWIIPDKK